MATEPEDTFDAFDGDSAAVTGSGAAWSRDSESAPSSPGGDPALPFDIPEGRRYGAPRLLGIGAMGRVDAVHDGRLERTVAMKTMRHEAEGSARRFIREATLTASLDHPGVVSVHDAGRHPDGRLFYTMRLVQGRPLSELLADARDPAARPRLLRPLHAACEAVAYAHAADVIHRDLKPSNIMLSDFGQVQVVDWGLARKLTGGRAAAGNDEAAEPSPSPTPEVVRGDLTQVGAVLGTPAYMSPEQARGERATKATDVWALGAVLFEVLAGRRLADAGPDPDLGATARGASELEAVLARALAPAPDARYPDAAALADDLGAYLEGRRVSAHAYTTWEILRRIVRAWRGPVLIAAAALIGLAAVGALSYEATVAERDRAREAEARVRAAEADTRAVKHRAERQLARSLTELAVRRLHQHNLSEAGLLATEALARAPDLASARGVLSALPPESPLTLRSEGQLPPDCLSQRVSPTGEALACLHPDAVSLWRVSPLEPLWRSSIPTPSDAGFLDEAGLLRVIALTGRSAAGYDYPQVHFLNLEDGERLDQGAHSMGVDGCEDHGSLSLCWGGGFSATLAATVAPSGPVGVDITYHRTSDDRAPLFATMRAGSRRAVVVTAEAHRSIDLRTGQPGPARPSPLPLQGVAGATLGDGTLLVGDVQGGLSRFDVEAGVASDRVVAGRGMVSQLSLTEDDRWAFARFDGSGALIWDVAAWRPVLRIPTALGLAALSRDGRTLTTVDPDRRVRHFDLHIASPRRFEAPDGLTSARLSPDGETLVGTGEALTVWPRAGGPRRDLPVPGRPLEDAAFSLDGERLYGVSTDAGLDAWHVDTWEALTLAAPRRGDRRVMPLAEGWVAFGGLSLGLKVFRPSPVPTTTNLLPEAAVGDLYAAPGGRRLVTHAGQDIYELTLEPGTPPELRPLMEWPDVRALAVGDTGRLVVVDPSGVSVLDDPGASAPRPLEGSSRGVVDVALSGDERLVAGGGQGGGVSVWDAETGRLVGELDGHRERVPSVAFSRDGRWLVSASWDRTARLWEVDALRADAGVIRARRDAQRRALGLELDALVGRAVSR